MLRTFLVCCGVGLVSAAHAQTLSFEAAVGEAEVDGPTIVASRSRLDAARLEVRPAGQLPDPELTVGVENFPVSGPVAYRFNRDEMTMASVGVMQAMPSDAERQARTDVARAQVGRAEAGLDIARLEARLGAAQAWIGLYYAGQKLRVIEQLAESSRSLTSVSRARLAAGGSVSDTLSAEIEASRAADQFAEAQAAMVGSRAELRRWIGDGADLPLDDSPPVFVIDPEHLRIHFRRHPALAAFVAERSAAEASLRLAQAEAQPDWTWELSYGRRDPAFGDVVSVEVRVGLPLFQGDRQRPLAQARQADLARTEALRQAAEREHAAMLESRLALHAALIANAERAKTVILPLARQRATAARSSYEAGAGYFADLVEADRAQLDAELAAIELNERLSLLGALLTLEYGEEAP